MVMANNGICFLQDMGIKFFTNAKVRQPVVCTSETVRPSPYFLNAGFMASTHHVKSSGNIGDRKEILFFSLNEAVFMWHGHDSTHVSHWYWYWLLVWHRMRWLRVMANAQKKPFRSTLLIHVQFHAGKCWQPVECHTKLALLTLILFWPELVWKDSATLWTANRSESQVTWVLALGLVLISADQSTSSNIFFLSDTRLYLTQRYISDINICVALPVVSERNG